MGNIYFILSNYFIRKNISKMKPKYPKKRTKGVFLYPDWTISPLKIGEVDVDILAGIFSRSLSAFSVGFPRMLVKEIRIKKSYETFIKIVPDEEIGD